METINCDLCQSAVKAIEQVYKKAPESIRKKAVDKAIHSIGVVSLRVGCIDCPIDSREKNKIKPSG